MKKHSILNSVAVKTPCSQDWDLMYGNDEVRFCEHCVKHVHDISAMTRRDAEKFVARSKGSVCIRYVRRPDGKIQTASDKLYQISSRASRLAASVFGASLTLASSVYAQGGMAAAPAQEQAAVEPNKKIREFPKKAGDSIYGTVTDRNGAVIPGAQGTLTNSKTGASQTATSDENGAYAFTGVEEGIYKLEFKHDGGFRNQTTENISVQNGFDTELNLTMDLAPMQMEVVVGDIAVGVQYENELLLAVLDDDVEKVKSLIIQGANVNEKDKNDGTTALHVAVLGDHLEVVRTLLKFGARPNIRDNNRRTPLMQLVIDSDSEEEDETEPSGKRIFDLLITYGAKVNLRDSEGYTALMHAAGNENPVLLRLLISHRANINTQAKDGYTALMAAAEAGELENVRILLEAGADFDLKNNEGDTALSLADDEDIRQLLISYGAKPEPEEPEETDEP